MKKIVVFLALLFTFFSTNYANAIEVEIDDTVFVAIVSCDKITIDNDEGSITLTNVKYQSGNILIKEVRILSNGKTRIYLPEGVYCVTIDGVSHEIVIK